MKTEKIFPQPNGDKIKVTLSLHCDSFSTPSWEVRVFKCQAKKRTWFNAIDYDSHKHRALSFPEGRDAHIKEQIAALVPVDGLQKMKEEYVKQLLEIK